MPINEEVLLKIRTNWQGDAVRRGIQGLEQQVQNLGRSVRSSLGILLPGIGGLGLVGGLALATREAIKLSAEFQKMQVGMAALLGSYGKVVDAQGRVLSGAERFNQLLKMSAGLMQEVRKEADRTILETRELMEYVQSGLGFALSKGLTPQQAIKLISQIGTAGRTLGLPQGYPIISEIRALLTGEGIARSQIAQALGITAADLQKRMGEQFLKYMYDRLQGFTTAADSFANSFEARWSTFISKIQEILREVGEAILPVLSDFARDAAEAIDRWKATGGAQRLQETVRDVMSAVIAIMQMIWQAVQWLQKNSIVFRGIIDAIAARMGWKAGASIGGAIGSTFGPWGALIGAGLGAGGAELLQWQFRQTQEQNRNVAALRQQIQKVIAKKGSPQLKQRIIQQMLEISLEQGAISSEDVDAILQWMRGQLGQAGAPAPGQAPGLPRFLAAPPRPSMEAQKAAQKAAAQQKLAAEKQRVAEAQASYREWSAQNRLQQAIQEAEQAGWTAASIGKVQSALAAWKQAYLQAASVRSAGEPPAIAQIALARAREEIAIQEREIQERIQRGQERAQQEKARQWQEFVQSYRQRILTAGKEPIEERLWMGAMAPFPPLIRFGLEPLAPIYKAVLRRGYEEYIAQERERQLQERIKAEQEQIRAEQERRMREAQRRQIQMLAGYGGLWAEAFGAPAVAAGAMRMALGGISPLARMIADAIAQAQIAVRQRWQEFWEAMAEFASDSVRDAFVRMTMDLMANLGRWKDAFKDFAQAIRQMIQRAIAEIIYERFIKRAVDQLLAQVIAALSRGKGGGGGGKQKSGLLGGALMGYSVGGWLGAAVGGLLGAIGIFQHGGTLLPNQIGWVGERGPELVVSGTSAAVLSSQRVADLLSRLQEPRVGTVNVYINSMGDVDMARRVGREVDRALRRVRY